MKLRLFLISSFLSVAFCGFGQSYVMLLKDKTTEVKKMIHAEEKVVINCLDGKSYKGKLIILGSSEIKIGADSIEIDKIKSIRAHSKSFNIKNGIIIGTGSILISLGAISLADVSGQTIKPNFNPLPIIGVIGAGAILSAVGVANLIRGKTFKKERWEFSIINE